MHVRPTLKSPSNQVGVGPARGMNKTGVTPGRQVMHADQHRCMSRRGSYIVGPVHEVDSPSQELDRGEVRASPQLSKQARRSWATESRDETAGPGSESHRCRNLCSASCCHSQTNEFQLRNFNEAGNQLVNERPNSRLIASQWRYVKSDSHTVRLGSPEEHPTLRTRG